MAGLHVSAILSEPDSGQRFMQNTTDQRRHPRRTSPRDFQLLTDHKRRKLSHSPDEKSVSNPPLSQLKSQGSSSNQSASRWFDSANKHVAQSDRVNSGFDDEPPFFLTNQTSYVPNTFAPSEGSRMFGVQSRLDSENEDLRGIVDDLTVENKRLKQILRVNRHSQRNSPGVDSHDKLFEVRMHGLSSEKRRELEFLLKNFATSVHTTAPSLAGSNTGSGISSSSNAIPNGKAKTDSGYASNSNSGQPSNALPQPLNRGTAQVSQSNRDNSISKYLHDIPDTLLPRQHPIVMSERSKMALVVRRMEQLFTGRNAAPGEHSQPLQQQEVSQMAAWAEAKNSKKRKAEGTREAHILPPDSKVNFDTVEIGPIKRKRLGLKTSDSDMSASDDLEISTSRPGSPDQRPTRPLDLDIHRAQVAAENIEYMRHLGLSSPHLDADPSDDSWMFLNLLINMAQLHTVNVTPDFVRKSIQKLSTKFELSKDGHKVRWIGGPDGTVFSKEEEKALEIADSHKDNNSPDDSIEELAIGSGGKRSKTDNNSNAMVSNTTSEDKASGPQTSSASKQQTSTAITSNQVFSPQQKPVRSNFAFDYKPIVYRGPSRDVPDELYLLDSDSSAGSTSRDSSGLVQALSRSNLTEQRNADEGTITFYNNPHFCSDYSGDTRPSNMLSTRDNVPGLVIGIHPGDNTEGEVSRLADACYFTPQFGPAPFRHPRDDRLPALEIAPFSTANKDEMQPIELTASGLGGTIPEDNFAIEVDVSMARIPGRAQSTAMHCVPFTGTAVFPRFGYECQKSEKITLLPSRLPPPSYIFFTSSSSSGNQVDDDEEDSESDSDSDSSSSSSDGDNPAPPTFLQHWSTDDSGEIDDGYDDPDDSSVDMLAQARAADPLRIAEQERQYMINEPGGRAAAGSLAATVGASRSSTSCGSVASDQPEVDSEYEEDSDMEVDNE